jgi:hypothetical protein
MTEQLRTTGFLFTQLAIALPVLSADYGDAYRAPGAVIGNSAGLRSWSAKIDALPDDASHWLVAGQARASYLWDFWLARKTADDEPFYLYDHKDDVLYLASFADDALTFEILCAKVFSTGLQFRERRVDGVTSPIAGLPIVDEQASDALLDEQSGDALLDEGVF